MIHVKYGSQLVQTGWQICSFSNFRPSGVSVCFVFEACTLWETCYPPWSISSVVHLASHVKRARDFNQRSVWIMRQISWRSEIDRPKVPKEARCCQSVRKLLFSFARAPAKCGRNGPPMHVHWGIRVRQTPKVVRVHRLFGQAGEPTIWRQNDRARNKALWTHLGPCLMHKCISNVRPSSE